MVMLPRGGSAARALTRKHATSNDKTTYFFKRTSTPPQKTSATRLFPRIVKNICWYTADHQRGKHKAVFAFVQTLTPVQHCVGNSLEATICPMCGYKPGLSRRTTGK